MTNSKEKIQIFWSDGTTDQFPAASAVIALGTFDGVHSAHLRLISETISLKIKVGAQLSGAWCFAKPPASILRGADIPMLTQLNEKINIMLSCGLDFVAVGDFQDFRESTADDFVINTLKNDLKCVGAVCGFNHRFGYKGLGSPELLEKFFGPCGIITVPEMKCGDLTISSSTIREKISNGEIDLANTMLGRNFSLTAEVVSNKKLGREIGFPTANQFFPSGTIVPKNGIYATLCTIEDGKKYIGVSNVGIRPTIVDGTDDHLINCETYIHNFFGDLYGKQLTVEFCSYLRPEAQFDSIESLKAAIANDRDSALNYFKSKNKDQF